VTSLNFPNLASIIMIRMFRVALFLLIVMVFTLPSTGQTPPPPGAPFDASRHPNPIVTFVEEKDFKPATYAQAKKDAGIELLGLSQDEGKRESVELADGRFAKNMSILNFRTDVTFYPVVREKYKLAGGSDLVLYSFRFPRVALPREYARIILNEAAVEKKKKPNEMRFGGTAPQQLEIRGARGLLWEKEGQTTVVYWQEEGVGHVAMASLPRQELFRVIEDLL
jgi:hypothetical protein